MYPTAYQSDIWLHEKRVFYAQQVRPREVPHQTPEEATEFLRKLKYETHSHDFDKNLAEAGKQSKKKTLGLISLANFQLAQFVQCYAKIVLGQTQKQTVSPGLNTIVHTYGNSWFFITYGKHQGDLRLVLPLQDIIHTLDLSPSEIYLLLLAAANDDNNELVRSLFVSNCIEALQLKEDPEVDAVVDALSHHVVISFSYPPMISLSILKTLISIELGHRQAAEQQALIAFNEEIEKTMDANELIKLLADIVIERALDINSVVIYCILRYVFCHLKVYQALINTSIRDFHTDMRLFLFEPDSRELLLKKLHFSLNKCREKDIAGLSQMAINFLKKELRRELGYCTREHINQGWKNLGFGKMRPKDLAPEQRSALAKECQNVRDREEKVLMLEMGRKSI